MTKLHTFFIKPFVKKGFLWGLADLLVKVLAMYVWVYILCILGSLIAETLRLDYNRLTNLWWFTYCFIIFFGATLLAYIVLFVRDYNEEEETEEEQ